MRKIILVTGHPEGDYGLNLGVSV